MSAREVVEMSTYNWFKATVSPHVREEFVTDLLDELKAAGYAVIPRAAIVDAIQWRDWDAVRGLLTKDGSVSHA